MHKLYEVLVEQRLFQSIIKHTGFIWKRIDLVLGITARSILRRTCKINPNKVFFHTQETRYCCNPKYIFEALLRDGLDGIEVVWKGPSDGMELEGLPSGIKTVKQNSFEYFKEMLTSKVVVTNSFLFLGMPLKLKEGQLLIQTWHGSLGIKKYGPMDIKDTRKRVTALKQTGQMTTYCLSNSILENNSFRDTYWPHTPILDYGHARNDLFFDNNRAKRTEIRNRFLKDYGLTEDTKFIMYAPTFRDNHDVSVYDIDFERVLSSVTKRFGGKWMILLRYHPSMAKLRATKNIAHTLRNIPHLDVTDYQDMQELISLVDVGITDYSSWIYDYVLLRKPGFIYAPDIKEYEGERGFYYPIESTPFPIAENNEQLSTAIREFNTEAYLQDVERFLKDKGCIEDGHAAERAARLIKDLLNGKEITDAIID